MADEFNAEFFMLNIRLLSAKVDEAIVDAEEAAEQGPAADEDEKIAILDAQAFLRDAYVDPLNQMATATLFALEHLGARGLAKDLRKELTRHKRKQSGFARLETAYGDEGGCYSPVLQTILKYAHAVTGSFEFVYGDEDERLWLKRCLRRTRNIMLLQEVADPGKEGDVRGAVYEFLRIMFNDTVRDPHIGQPGTVYKPDIGIKHLRTAVEYKYIGKADEVNTAVDGIYADVPAYRDSRDWRFFIGVIYMTDEYVPIPELKRRFAKLPQNWEMIIIVGSGERKKREQ